MVVTDARLEPSLHAALADRRAADTQSGGDLFARQHAGVEQVRFERNDERGFGVNGRVALSDTPSSRPEGTAILTNRPPSAFSGSIAFLTSSRFHPVA